MDPTEAIYVTSLEEILWGILLVAVTMIVHGLGMVWTIAMVRGQRVMMRNRREFMRSLSPLILASWLIIVVHLVEVMIWACFFQWKHCFANLSTAFAFALMNYTTVGSNYNLPQNWQLLGGMIATAGLLGFAWSTAVLLTLANKFQTRQLHAWSERRRARNTRR
jgi:hypothetical protein